MFQIEKEWPFLTEKLPFFKFNRLAELPYRLRHAFHWHPSHVGFSGTGRPDSSRPAGWVITYPDFGFFFTTTAKASAKISTSN